VDERFSDAQLSHEEFESQVFGVEINLAHESRPPTPALRVAASVTFLAEDLQIISAIRPAPRMQSDVIEL